MKKRILSVFLGTVLVLENGAAVSAAENSIFPGKFEQMAAESSQAPNEIEIPETIEEEQNSEILEDSTDPGETEWFAGEEDAVFTGNGEEEFLSEDGISDGFSDGTEVWEDQLDEKQEKALAPDATEAVLDAEQGSDITEPLNQLLLLMSQRASAQNPCKVTIPPGNYRLSGTICMYSNLTLCAEGAVITKTSVSKHVLLRLGNQSESAGGYDGYQNITIEGGTWDCNYAVVEDKDGSGGFVSFRIGHANNVTIRNVTFLNNLKSHFVELAGVKNATVTGCTFRGYYEAYEGGGQECIQLDACLDYIFPGYQPFDGAVCENILIEGNTFENVFAGVGSHSMMYDRPYRNIVVRGNIFRNIKKRTVWCLNYVDSQVEDNVMENVGGGVLISSMYLPNTHLVPGTSSGISGNHMAGNISVKRNRISISSTSVVNGSTWKGYGIQVQGKKTDVSRAGIPADTYKESQVTIEGNTITGPGTGIALQLAEDCTISNNQLNLECSTGFSNMGISLAASSQNIVRDNLVSGCKNVGIYLYNGGSSIKMSSINNRIERNLVSQTCGDGILTEAGCTGTVISKNQIASGRKNGILVRGSKNCQVAGNQVTKCGLNGIYLDNLGNATIKNNKMENCSGWGLGINSSGVRSIYGNYAASNKKCGIYAKQSKISGNKRNRLEGNKSPYAIYASKCTGILTVRVPVSAKITRKTTRVTGKAPGGRSLTIYAVGKNSNKRIGRGYINSSKRYSVAIHKQKKGTVLRFVMKDKYGNISYCNKKVK